MAQKQKKINSNQIKLIADIILFGAFMLANGPQATGIPIHEWISILFIVPIMLHLLLDWKWVVSVTKRMFKRMPGKVRFNQIWDLLIFIMMVFVLFNGLIISQAALPAMGIHITIDPFWVTMHGMSANLLMILVGVHLAVHWKWIVNMFKRYILRQPVKQEQAVVQGDK